MTESNQSPVELAWDAAALGYDGYFGPRFAPYLAAAVGALLACERALPRGCIVVPCTGPGRELGPLARALPARAIVASDLSREMVALARARNASLSNVSIEQADATRLRAPQATVAAVLSIFGLQLLPDPPAVLAAWLRLLAPGGVAAIMYWPQNTGTNGPFQLMHRLLEEAGVRGNSWETQIESSIAEVGATIRSDVRLGFEMPHDDAATLWQAFTRFGALRALALSRGQALVDSLGVRFVAELPAGPIQHAPEARLLVLERG